jgi:hypothetical protein
LGTSHPLNQPHAFWKRQSDQVISIWASFQSGSSKPRTVWRNWKSSIWVGMVEAHG